MSAISVIDRDRPAAAYNCVLLLMFVPFLMWSFLGGHKQHFWGVSSDHFFTMVALAAALIIIFSKKCYTPTELSIFILFFILIGLFFVSVLRSADPVDSVAQLVVAVVYILVSLGIALFFKSKVRLFFNLIISVSCFSSLTILVSFLFLGLGAWGRLTIPVYQDGIFSYFPAGYESSSDPNVLSYFIYIGILTVFYFKGFSGWWRLVCFVLFCSALLTMSRSGFVGFSIAVLTYFSIVFISAVSAGKYSVSASSMFFGCFLFWVAGLGLLFFDVGFFYSIILDRINDEGSNADRIQRIMFSLDVMLESGSAFFFGHGVGHVRRTVDPHIFYFSTIVDTGFFSLGVMLLLLFVPVIGIWRRTRCCKARAFVFSLVVFFMTISLFYWQVRTYYFVLLVLFVLYFSNSFRVGFRKGRPVIV